LALYNKKSYYSFKATFKFSTYNFKIIMFILSVAPITKIPLPGSQVFSYFYKDNLNTGAVVSVVLNNRTVPAIVLSCEKLTPIKKMNLIKK
jgi:hypothetical protein